MRYCGTKGWLKAQAMLAKLHSLLASDGPIVATIRARLPEAIAIYAFGSQVQGTADRESDLDLAVLVAGYAEPLILWDTAGSLADVAGCPVDLLDLRAASTVMQYQVITTGQRLWSAGLQAGLFECFILSEKTALDTARAPLLADIQSTGVIHAR
jgi:predicted nucleotidyltransferase